MATSSIRFTPLHSFSSPLLSKAIISPKLKFVNITQIGNPFKFQLKKSFKVKGISVIVRAAIGKLSELDPVPVGPESVFPNGSGVYGIYDKNAELQFIGISRNLGASIESHSKLGPDLCYSVKVGLMDEPSPDRTVLTSAWKSWMEEHIAETGKVPPGNAKGNTTWARPPPQKKPNLHLTPGRHVKLTVPLKDLIDRLVKEKEVVAFIKGTRSAPLCGFSQKVVGILESTGVDFECVDVLDEEYNYGLRETLKRYSNWPTFPQVFVKGELLGGCDIISDMAEKGELATIFKK